MEAHHLPHAAALVPLPSQTCYQAVLHDVACDKQLRVGREACRWSVPPSYAPGGAMVDEGARVGSSPVTNTVAVICLAGLVVVSVVGFLAVSEQWVLPHHDHEKQCVGEGELSTLIPHTVGSPAHQLQRRDVTSLSRGAEGGGRRCMDIPVFPVLCALGAGLLCLMLASMLSRVVYNVPFGLHASREDVVPTKGSETVDVEGFVMNRVRMVFVHDQVVEAGGVLLRKTTMWGSCGIAALSLATVFTGFDRWSWETPVAVLLGGTAAVGSAWSLWGVLREVAVRGLFLCGKGAGGTMKFCLSAAITVAVIGMGSTLLVTMVALLATQHAALSAGAVGGWLATAFLVSVGGTWYLQAARSARDIVAKVDDLSPTPANAGVALSIAGEVVGGGVGLVLEGAMQYGMAAFGAIHLAGVPYGKDGTAAATYLVACTALCSVGSSFILSLPEAPQEMAGKELLEWRRRWSRYVMGAVVCSVLTSSGMAAVVLFASGLGWRPLLCFAAGGVGSAVVGCSARYVGNCEHRPVVGTATQAVYGALNVIQRGIGVASVGSVVPLAAAVLIAVVASAVGDGGRREGGDFCVLLAGIGASSTVVVDMALGVLEHIGRVMVAMAEQGAPCARSGCVAAVGARSTPRATLLRYFAPTSLLYLTYRITLGDLALPPLSPRVVGGLLLASPVLCFFAAVPLLRIPDVALDVVAILRGEVGATAPTAGPPDMTRASAACAWGSFRRLLVPLASAVAFLTTVAFGGGTGLLLGTMTGLVLAVFPLITVADLAGSVFASSRVYMDEERITSFDAVTKSESRLVRRGDGWCWVGGSGIRDPVSLDSIGAQKSVLLGEAAGGMLRDVVGACAFNFAMALVVGSVLLSPAVFRVCTDGGAAVGRCF